MSGLEIVSALIAIIGGIATAYQNFKAKQYKAGFDSTSNALSSIVAAVELYRQKYGKTDPRSQEIKDLIQSLAQATGAEGEALANIVSQVTDMMNRTQTFDTGISTLRQQRAAEAVQLYKDAQAKKKPSAIVTGISTSLLLVFLMLMPTGCSTLCPVRATNEVVITETDGNQYLDVEWPTYAPSDVTLYETIKTGDGRVHTVAPLTIQAPGGKE
jgi:hypothetical protein